MNVMNLTSRERIMRVFRNEPYDRPVFKLWGANPGMKPACPAYKSVVDRALEVTDIFSGAGSPFNIYAGEYAGRFFRSETRPTGDPEWNDRITYCETGGGTLRSVDRVSTVGKPGYTVEHMLKEPGDLKKLLTLPYEPYPADMKGYRNECARIGDRGIVTFGLDDPAYALARMAGSENFALFSCDCRELVEEAVAVYSGRVHEHVKAVLSTGIAPVFSWVGPELCIPPLMAVRDFEEFVVDAEKPYCDAIHDAGGFVWVHCHGKVAKLMESFIRMGVDVLNPLEPPKNGDVVLSEIAERFGSRIGLEGNIEIQELLTAETEDLKELMRECVAAGAKSGRFILCPSAGFMEYVNPELRYIDNLMTYLYYGYELVEALR